MPERPAGLPDRVRHPVARRTRSPASRSTKQAAYLAIAEHIAYVNPRVAAFSQYLMSDDPPRSSGYRYGGFESGLRTRDGKKKPAYKGFRLPLAVEGYGDAATCCGASCARSARRRKVTIEVAQARQGQAGRSCKTLTTTATGVYALKAPHRKRPALPRAVDRARRHDATPGPPITSY